MKSSFEKFVITIAAMTLAAIIPWGAGQGRANETAPPVMRSMMTNAQHKAAAERAKAAMMKLQLQTIGAAPIKPLAMDPEGTPDYFGNIPNYANSPLPTYDPITRTYIGGIRKFVDGLPGLGPENANNLGQYIPIAEPMTPPDGVPNDGDYYEIGEVQYTEQMHSDLPPTKLRGYVDLNPIFGNATSAHSRAQYLGPMIISRRDRPVRIKVTNMFPTSDNPDSELFIPVDTSYMGAGMGHDQFDTYSGIYTQNRTSLHLHGGVTPWISDGTPNQWFTPAGDPTPFKTGPSFQNVPDMPDPGEGSQTIFYTNQQSARLMFYHDHAYGITRLNVYAGMAAGYLITDPEEDNLIDNGVIPGADMGIYRYGIPLIIQDKTFVPDTSQLETEDPTWDIAKWGGLGNLWFPHVYMTNQNPADDSGANAMGRWDYGPWFWPPVTPELLAHGPVENPLYGTTPMEGEYNPGTPNPSGVPESFMDTPVINGTAYPTLNVEPKAYRFRILNAANDRFFNLQLYFADKKNPTEVRMVPAVPGSGLPDSWPTDSREGGVPDPKTAGPSMIQIGNEGGFLPAPVMLPNTPVGYNYNRRDIVVLNVENKTLFLGPAERADVIIDFSQVKPGSRIILYNDAPAPVPAYDTRYDFYTGDPDQTDTGGAPTTIAGYGPNTRTMMEFIVVKPAVKVKKPAPYNLAALEAQLPIAYIKSQDAAIVPETAYGAPTNTYSRIESTSLDLNSEPVDLTAKAIQELFELNYGKMNAILGTELPFTNFNTQTTIPLGYVDPPTENIEDGQVQLWKITHNGVDTHAIHVHLFNVQVVNRVGWDGAIRPPDPNELGWKETVRMNPLEDIVVALKPVTPKLPFDVPHSVRLLDPTEPEGSLLHFTDIDPYTNNPITTVNEPYDFGWEYVWHCHLLGHEENDMMRPISFMPADPVPGVPDAPAGVMAVAGDGGAALSFSAPNDNGSAIMEYTVTASSGVTTTLTGPFSDPVFTNFTGLTNDRAYGFRVVATNANGDSASSDVSNVIVPTASVPPAPTGLTATASVAAVNPPTVSLKWSAGSNNETGFTIQRASGKTFLAGLVEFVVDAGTMVFTDTTIARGSKYYYRVKATNAIGDSLYSNIAKVGTAK